jgi:hypothetical protein
MAPGQDLILIGSVCESPSVSASRTYFLQILFFANTQVKAILNEQLRMVLRPPRMAGGFRGNPLNFGLMQAEPRE